MKKTTVIAFSLSLLTVLFLSSFKLLDSLYLFPNFLWIVPLFGLYSLTVSYFTRAFKTKLSPVQKLLIILIGFLGVISLLCVGFLIWKVNYGNIFLETQSSFELNLKNIFFWVVYQSYLLLFFFSSFKQVVTYDQK
jgi:hypothetical protein